MSTKLNDINVRVREARERVREAQDVQRSAEGEMVDYLITHQMFDCFNVNWSRIRRYIRHNS